MKPACSSTTWSARFSTRYPSGTTPPIQMPFFFEAAILSRIRSPVTSRSNWAKDNRTFSVNRPMLVERLGHRDEGDLMRIEEFDQLGEVGEQAGQPVDLVDDDHVDSARANVIQQLLERWPVHRAAGIAAVVVAVPDQPPAFMGLTFDVGFRCLPLIVERVELLLEPMLGRDASVDSAAQARLAAFGLHGEAAVSRQLLSTRATAISPTGARPASDVAQRRRTVLFGISSWPSANSNAAVDSHAFICSVLLKKRRKNGVP